MAARNCTDQSTPIRRISSANSVVDIGRKKGRTPQRLAKPNYGTFRQRILKLTPSNYHCKFFCGGNKCRYCTGIGWRQEQQALQGVYSTWITTNLIAMARPTTAAINSSKLIDQFKKCHITSIVNLQRAWEHKDCSPNVFSPGGFSYDPEDFMKNEIFHYNFGWPDYGTSNLSSLLDMVKVLSFALKDGSVAVHCHAGLGRTGVFIACYLVWEKQFHAAQAIAFVRTKRPNSIQTKEQVETVYSFESFVSPLLHVFRFNPRVSLEEYLKKQRLLLHGVEERILKFIPKIVYVICERLLELGGVSTEGTLDRKLILLSAGDDIFYFERIMARNAILVPTSTDDAALNSGGTLGYIRTLSHSPKSLKQRSNFQTSKSLDFGRQKSVSFAELPKPSPHRLPPINLSQSLNLERSKQNSSQTFNDNLPWDTYEKAQTLLISELPTLEVNSAPARRRSSVDAESGKIDFQLLIEQCLSQEKLPRDLYAVIENYQTHLEHRNASWRKLINEEDPDVLALLLREWFKSLEIPAVPESIILPSSQLWVDSRPNLSSSQKWIILYLSNVFHRLMKHSDIQQVVDDSALLLADWLSWSREENVKYYYLSCLGTVAE